MKTLLKVKKRDGRYVKFNIKKIDNAILAAVNANNFPLSKESVIDAMKNNLKPKFHEMNLKAIESGYKSIKG